MTQRQKDTIKLCFLLCLLILPLGSIWLFNLANDKSSFLWKTNILTCERKGYGFNNRLEIRIKESSLPKIISPAGTVLIKLIDEDGDNEGYSDILPVPMYDFTKEELLEYQDFVDFLIM